MLVQRTLSQIFPDRKKKKDILTGKAENKFNWLNIISQTAIAAADHVSALVKECFPDSKIVQSYSHAKKKRFCVLNRAIYPELQQIIDRLNDRFSAHYNYKASVWFMRLS